MAAGKIMMTELISLRPQSLRSVHLERDFYAIDTDGYLVTRGALSAFSLLARGSTDPVYRAQSISGPYGAGKSALAMYFARLLDKDRASLNGFRERARDCLAEVGERLIPLARQGYISVLATRHILSISGGKDSAALAIYMRDYVPNMEYIFCDTHEELPETYVYIDMLEAFLGKPIRRLNPDRPFVHYLRIKGFYLPSPRVRWCVELMKLKPFEAYVGSERAISYIGIRSDEDRDAYISTKPNIRPMYPFREDGVGLQDVYRVLEECGVGLPDYYRWRSRSGCYFCFFQRKIEWVGLLENHPDLFEKARQFEKMKLDERSYR